MVLEWTFSFSLSIAMMIVDDVSSSMFLHRGYMAAVKRSAKGLAKVVGGLMASWMQAVENCPPQVWLAMRPPH